MSAEPDDRQKLRYDALTRQLEDGLGRDILGAFAADVQSRAGIEIDQRALDAGNASFGAGGHSGV